MYFVPLDLRDIGNSSRVCTHITKSLISTMEITNELPMSCKCKITKGRNSLQGIAGRSNASSLEMATLPFKLLLFEKLFFVPF